MIKILSLLKSKSLTLVVLFCLLIFAPVLGNFFSGDDWFHLRVVQINSFDQFFNFFSFKETAQSISFYRPLSTQVLFFVFYNIFRLNSVPYFLFGLILFGGILISIFKLSKMLGFSKNIALMTTLIYGVSATNFTRINFISAFQELFLTLFIVLALNFYLKNKKIYFLFFLWALLSKETAVIFLGLIFLVDFYRKKFRESYKNYIVVGLITGVYLYLRFFIFKGVSGDSYIWDFSPKKALNTLMWYGLWTLGTPEFLVDYVGSGFKILPKFFAEINGWSNIIIFELMAVLTTLGLIILSNLKNLRNSYKDLFLGVEIFSITLVPVLFLPWHKFSHALGLPLIGFALGVAVLISKKRNLGLLFLTIFLLTNLTTIHLLKEKHYSVTRGVVAKKVFNYVESNYKNYPENKYFKFINDTNPEAKQWGSSKQISYALSGSDFFKVYFKDKNIKVYYDDLDKNIPNNTIDLSSKEFLE